MLAAILTEAPAATKAPVCTKQAYVATCSCCGPAAKVADLEMEISVGFGQAIVTKDDETVYDEMHDEPWTVAHAEASASKDPNHDWRIVMDSPSRALMYQRHASGLWVLIKEEDGFA